MSTKAKKDLEFNLPSVGMKGYQNTQQVPSSAINTEAQRLNAVDELHKWTRDCLNKRRN